MCVCVCDIKCININKYLPCQIATLQSELDQCHLVESQLRETVTQTELLLAETQEQLQLRSRSLNETCSAELAELNEEVSNLQTVKVGLVFSKVMISSYDLLVSGRGQSSSSYYMSTQVSNERVHSLCLFSV